MEFNSEDCNKTALFISNTNKELAEILGTAEKIPHKYGVYRNGGWRLDPKFIDHAPF